MSRMTLTLKSVLWLMVVAVCVPVISSAALAQYTKHNLVTTAATSAPHHDGNLVNAWGLSFLPTSPFWVSDNGTGKTTIYDPTGGTVRPPVNIPSATGKGLGTPTGQVANPDSSIFMISKKTATGTKTGSALFIFATLDGTISGWNPNVDPNNAVIARNRNAEGVMFTGLAIVTVNSSPGGGPGPYASTSQTFLYAADAAHNRVLVFDSTFKIVHTITDPHTPAGLSVYGIQAINGKVYITLGAFGSTAGAVDVYDPATNHLSRLITNGPGGPLNEPWGLAIAPSDFGVFSNDLLVGNVGNGWINAFNPTTGKFLGRMKNKLGQSVFIPGLWALEFGGGTAANGQKNQLFFTGGPNGYLAGVFGVIEP